MRQMGPDLQVQALARIGLNLSSVERFVVTACSLADDNRTICESVRRAAGEAKSAALLIDHLRNLFSHQQSIDERSQQQHFAPFAPKLPPKDSPKRKMLQEANCNTSNMSKFTYSNRQTLFRASRCFVSAIAKILYLTDSVVLQSDWNQTIFLQSTSSAAANDGLPASRQPNVGEQLDNVANYSQLLRAFSELGAELVDLGACLMLSRQQEAAATRQTTNLPGCRLAGGTLAAESPLGPLQQQQRLGPLRPSASSNSLGQVYACCLPQQQQQAKSPDANITQSSTKTLICPLQHHSVHLELVQQKIQDLHTLFQVNRLVIDRSILVLLGASKCCLRQGNECLRGLEARRSILGQIRGSIGIIMALVKSSIFGDSSGCPCSSKRNISSRSNLFDDHCNWPVDVGVNQATAASLATNEQRPSYLHQLQLQQCFFQATSHESHCSAACCRPQRALGPVAGHQADFRADFSGGSGPQPKQHQQQTSDVMDFFLLACNGTSSAHQVISRLQRLVEPFTKVTSYRTLLEALDCALLLSGGGGGGDDDEKPTSCQMKSHQVQYSSSGDSYVPASCNFGAGSSLAQFSIHPAPPPPQPVAFECDFDKENRRMIGGAPAPTFRQTLGVSQESSDGCDEHQDTVNELLAPVQHLKSGLLLMNKRQLASMLHATFLGPIRAQLTERIQEFTDCAYTRHENRESLLALVQCIKALLSRFVKLIYKLRRRGSCMNDTSLGYLHQLASLLDDTCHELKHELQTVVVEQCDEFDRNLGQVELLKQIKHHCLIGDSANTNKCASMFADQSSKLVELCKMLNQVAQTRKIKITTKTLVRWFDLNYQQLLAMAICLADNCARSQVLKDCTWAYMQVWCSFYDDFCQVARQVAYLTHSGCDSSRSSRISRLKEQMLARRQIKLAASYEAAAICNGASLASATGSADEQLDLLLLRHHNTTSLCSLQSLPEQCASANCFNCSNSPVWSSSSPPQPLHVTAAMLNETDTDSPRSLDHYSGFGANYREQRRLNTLAAHRGQPALGSLAGQQQHYLTGAQFGQQQPQIMQRQQSPSSSSSYWRPLIGQSTDPTIAAPGAFNCNSFEANQRPMMSSNLVMARPLLDEPQQIVRGPQPPARRQVTIDESSISARQQRSPPSEPSQSDTTKFELENINHRENLSSGATQQAVQPQQQLPANASASAPASAPASGPNNLDQHSSTSTSNTEQTADSKWSDSDADAIVRGARETAQMAMSMYQFTRGEGDLNTTQDLFTQAELFAEEANELYKEVRCFSYKVPSGDLKRELLSELSFIPALVQQLQFIVKNPTVGKPATFAKVDAVIRETKSLMEAVNRVVSATLSCRQHYNMAKASMRKRTRTLSPGYRGDSVELESGDAMFGGAGGSAGSGAGSRAPGAFGGRHSSGPGGTMGSEPDI